MSAQTICHAIDYGATTSGSFIPALASLSRAIVSRGDRFVVFATDVPGAVWHAELSAAGADVRLVRNEREVLAGIRALRPQVVHSHFNRFDLVTALTDRRARVFWHVHTHRDRRSRLSRLLAFAKYRVAGSRVEGVITVSESMREECIDWFARRERVHVVYNGIDTEHFRPPTLEERNDARAALGISPEDRVILFFERAAYKGGTVVKRAFDLLPQFRLIVTGGTREDRARFGEAPAVIAMERAADVRQLYWAADALAFASDREAFGFVLIEALACGVPIAATNISVVNEICNGAESVFVFDAGDAQGLAKAIERAVACENLAGGRAHVVERFSLDRWTAQTLLLYGRS